MSRYAYYLKCSLRTSYYICVVTLGYFHSCFECRYLILCAGLYNWIHHQPNAPDSFHVIVLFTMGALVIYIQYYVMATDHKCVRTQLLRLVTASSSSSNQSSGETMPTPTSSTSGGGLTSEVLHFVLEELRIKLLRGHSKSDLEEHLRNAARLNPLVPSQWSDVLKLLKELGYECPVHYKVCTQSDHSCLLKSHKQHPCCPVCIRAWKDCIDYYVLGLGFNQWFLTDERCEQLMAHWEDRESWLHGLSADQSELWHGERFQELASFWNPDATSLLPEFCTQCNAILTPDLISSALADDHNSSLCFVEVVCPACTAVVKVSPQYMQGDPRNQAVIIHEDGWAPHSTSAKHSVAAITITHACMTKLERSKGTNARVFAFIPVSQLPTKALTSLTPSLSL